MLRQYLTQCNQYAYYPLILKKPLPIHYKKIYTFAWNFKFLHKNIAHPKVDFTIRASFYVGEG